MIVPTLEALGIDQLSVAARIELATAIWDSIEVDPHPPLITEPQQRELEQQLADHAVNPDDVIPWDTIQAEALARYQR